jgi:hypothetical protein
MQGGMIYDFQSKAAYHPPPPPPPHTRYIEGSTNKTCVTGSAIGRFSADYAIHYTPIPSLVQGLKSNIYFGLGSRCLTIIKEMCFYVNGGKRLLIFFGISTSVMLSKS